MRALILISSILCLGLAELHAASRIKDLSMLEGRRDNQLVGYGLVVGLAGDGDSTQAEYTIQSIANTLNRFGIGVPQDDIRSNNVAAVMVTVDIPAFTKPGTRLDVLISSIGDADSLKGGVLLQTPLLGADDEVYAVAQGAVLVGGFFAGGEDASVQRNHPTVASIPNGAIVEKAIHTEILRNNHITFLLDEPDFATAVRMEEKINSYFPGVARAMSPTSVEVAVPEAYQGREMTFIASVESIEMQPDLLAKVVMNERTGTIVATAEVRLSEVAVSHGNITVNIARTPFVSQPGPFSQGDTVEGDFTNLDVMESQGGFSRLPSTPTLQELTQTLNSLGVGPRDMMVILKTIKQAGALHAELVLE
jgi:flagellar P-ring protein precursor FlgI